MKDSAKPRNLPEYRPVVTVQIPADIIDQHDNVQSAAKRINKALSSRRATTRRDAVSIAANTIYASGFGACLCPGAAPIGGAA